MTQWVGQLFGIENVSEIHSWKISFTAPWAQQYPVLLLFAVLGVLFLSIAYYVRFQHVDRRLGRVLMTAFRSSLLLILLLIFAEPAIKLSLTEQPKPLLLTLFDGSDSMNIVDRISGDSATKIKEALTPEGGAAPELDELSRGELVKGALAASAGTTLDKLSERVRIRSYVMDRPDRVREIHGEDLAEQISTDGTVSALGNAIRDLGNRHKGPLLAGLAVFSDFDKNAGGDPLAAARNLEAPIFTVGLAPTEVTDLSIELTAPPVLKKDVEATVDVLIRQTGLTGQAARVMLYARRLGTQDSTDRALNSAIEASPSQVVQLSKQQLSISMPFRPNTSGRYQLEARIEPFPDEVLTDNNSADRELTVRDDSLRLFFIEDEPSWEWRFVKEVFHRDEMIGREGFRTFLRAADFNVRRSNDLFEENLVPPRSEFFANDVVLLSDVPADMLTDRFQDMLEEYVKVFGGGLVVIAGPRNGLAELQKTRIADMLPVVPDPNATAKSSTFRMQLTSSANDYAFMNLSGEQRITQTPWNNLGKLYWYQPVLRPHPLATVLATHPSDRCVDNSTLQPIIATRRCEKGEVIYIGMNEMWRLRRLHGEEYYKRFWGQLIYRLGLSRALGSHKRFVVETERPIYQAGDQVRVTAEAFSLSFDTLNTPHLEARLITNDPDAINAPQETQIKIPKARGDTIFEATFPVYSPGTHRLLVRDPETSGEFETTFKVAPLSIERRSAARNVRLQQALADETGGRRYELHEFTSLIDDLPSIEINEITEHRKPLWNSWLVLGLVLFLMFAEWTTRKLMNLR